MTLATVIVVGLAAYRAARLITIDSLTEPLRDRLYRWAWGDTLSAPASQGALRTWINELLTCPHCISVWTAAAAYAWYVNWPRWPVYIAAIAGVASIAASFVAKAEAED